MIDSVFKAVRGILKLRGGTDGTIIGNNADRLRVSTTDPVYTMSTNTYSATFIGNAASAGEDNPIVLFKNPNGSGKTAYIWKIIVSGSAVTNVAAEFNIFSSPTISNDGSSMTIAARNIGAGQSASVMTLFSLPTISNSGTMLETNVTGQNTSSIDLTEDFSLAVQPNNNLLITADPSSNNRQVNITVVWKEV